MTENISMGVEKPHDTPLLDELFGPENADYPNRAHRLETPAGDLFTSVSSLRGFFEDPTVSNCIVHTILRQPDGTILAGVYTGSHKQSSMSGNPPTQPLVKTFCLPPEGEASKNGIPDFRDTVEKEIYRIKLRLLRAGENHDPTRGESTSARKAIRTLAAAGKFAFANPALGEALQYAGVEQQVSAPEEN